MTQTNNSQSYRHIHNRTTQQPQPSQNSALTISNHNRFKTHAKHGNTKQEQTKSNPAQIATQKPKEVNDFQQKFKSNEENK
jgi:phosphoglycerol transferase MdoB-like AlkP superfamily enzyme